MKVIQVPFCFHPDAVGGTEVYVEGLAHQLMEQGLQVLVCAPAEHDEAYSYGGLQVRRFAVADEVTDVAELYGDGDKKVAESFAHILEDEKPSVVHMHAFTRAVSVRLMREAKRRDLPVVFTYHTPTVSCLRGTLMHWGADVCDGTLRPGVCSSCALHGRGLHKAISSVIGRLPPALGGLVSKAGLSGRLWTGLRMSQLVSLRHAAFQSLMAEVDAVVVLCQWTKEVLERNGVMSSKITVSPHGLAEQTPVDGAGVAELSSCGGRLRIAFLGRLDRTKGPDLLIRAVRSLRDAALELHLYGITQGGSEIEFLEKLRAMAANDTRIVFHPPVSPGDVQTVLRSYHALAVPSQWLETGPLVVLEAFAAGVPVIASDLGGLREIVQDGVNGFLVEHSSPDAWCKVLGRLAENNGLLARLRSGIRPARSMAVVAEEMAAIYERLDSAAAIHRKPHSTPSMQ